MYATGWLYENEAKTPDSAAALYERLVLKAPSSAYAQRVQARVQEVQTVRRVALEKARADSVAKAAAQDSIKARQSGAATKKDSVAVVGQHPPTVPPGVRPDTLDGAERTVVPGQTTAKPDTVVPEEVRRPAEQPAAPPGAKPRKPRETPEEPRVE